MASETKISRSLIVLSALIIISCLAYLQFAHPVFYDPDSYYNMALTALIRDSGLHHKFQYAAFSALKDRFSDRDLLLHVFTVPFLYFAADPVIAGKAAAVFYMALFIAALGYLLKKYVPGGLAAVFLTLPFSSYLFSAYSLELRSITLVNILIILGIYFLITKRTAGVFFAAFLYSLAHSSFFIIIILALVCEALRLKLDKAFCGKNIYAAVLGAASGCLVHPDFPNNLINAFLNGILVPFYLAGGKDLGFSGETLVSPFGFAFFNNFALFAALIIIACVSLFPTARRLSLASAVWLASSCIFILFAFVSVRCWYQANAVFFIFAASYINDRMKDRDRPLLPRKIYLTIAIYMIAAASLVPYNLKQLKAFLGWSAERSLHYQDIGLWMRGNVPPGETIYHSYWDDSSYFIYFDPKNIYLSMNDPVYMFHSYPQEFKILEGMGTGRVGNPYDVFRDIFKTRYGYLRAEEPLCRQIESDPRRFKILYKTRGGMVFQLIT